MHFFSVPRDAGFKMQLHTDVLHTAGIGAGKGGGELGNRDEQLGGEAWKLQTWTGMLRRKCSGGLL